MEIEGLAGEKFCTSSGLLTATGASITYDTTVTINYCIDGQAYTKTAITAGTTPTTDQNTGVAFVALAINQTCWFVWMLNAAGTVAVVQGTPTAVDSVGGQPIVFPQFPAIPALFVPFAIHRIQTASNSSAWTFGVSQWGATGITKVLTNRMLMPGRPITTVAA